MLRLCSMRRLWKMELNNGIIKVSVSEHGAELRSVKKNDREYMWCADPKYWGRTSPVLFPFVGGLKNDKYLLNGKLYNGKKHGFARDSEFELAETTDNSATFILKENESTLKDYPFKFTLTIKYTLDGNKVKVGWNVKNGNDTEMSFSIGGHPAFNLSDGDNYFMFDNKNDIEYYLVDKNGLCKKDTVHMLENDGYVKMYEGMFDNDAFIIENNQVQEVSLCDGNKTPYVTVRFSAPLFGLWHPAGENIPFVCIEPWYGRCDASDFDGDLFEREYAQKLVPGESFYAEYEMEFK